MKHSMPRSRRTSTTKALVAGGLVALTAAGVGGAAFAAFSATDNASQPIASGTMDFVDITANGAGQRLSVGATAIAPGDTIQRAVTLTNSGTVAMAGVTLTTNATLSSLLDTDATNGLQMTIDKCSTAWVEAGTAPAYTYTCGGATTSVLTTASVIGANRALTNINAGAAATNYLRVTLTLPGTADNTFQAKSSVVQYTFNGTQRAAIAQ